MRNILDYLEHTARLVGEKTAVEDEQRSLTWAELVRLARGFGSAFAKKVAPGQPIVLMMEKSTETLAAMFGAVYAGCFYVIVDPSHPVERVNGIMNVLEPELVVTYEAHLPLLEQSIYDNETVLLPELLQTEIDEEKLAAIREQIMDTDILYGIFTSGSTGVPKGIVVNQRSVMDFIGHFTQTFGICETDRIGNQAPFDFDVSVKDIYSCMFTGATLVLIPKKMFATPPVLLDYLCDRKVNTLIWAVSALTLVSALKGLRYRVPEYVTRVMFSGEVMPVKQLKLWQKALPEAQFVNLYGPTEITCNCTYFKIDHEFENDEKLPLGIAFEGRQVFLLDENREPITEVGVSGEICVTGESIAVGYYHNEKETAAKFIDYKGDRCYCTGDLGYYDADGNLYFAGRKDFQIKHMGHRIELEEIEHHLTQTDGVDKCCCVFHEKRNQLVAYYMGTADTETIRTQMKTKVPVYMVPQKLIQTDTMPLTKNGKVDRNYFKNLLGIK